ncbi:hypothetical protein NW759_017489 [Fusarium solani]|nr:hypothetical protein NW759_017489 [Fusarium solani]
MYEALGVGVGGSVIAVVAALLATVPFVFYKYGEQLRFSSKFARTDDEENQASPAEEWLRQAPEGDCTSSRMQSSSTLTVRDYRSDCKQEGRLLDTYQNIAGKPQDEIGHGAGMEAEEDDSSHLDGVFNEAGSEHFRYGTFCVLPGSLPTGSSGPHNMSDTRVSIMMGKDSQTMEEE